MEMLISISLLLVVMTAGIHTFAYFSAEAQLAKGREIIDNLISGTNINSLTGKSIASDYYGVDNDASYQASRYFLYFKKNEDTGTQKAWEQEGVIVYGELQQGISALREHVGANGETTVQVPARNIDAPYTDLYQIIFTEKTEIPFPLFLQEILFTEKGDDVKKDVASHSVNNVFIFFDSPFGKVSFFTDSLLIKEKIGNIFSSYNKTVSDLSLADLSHELFIDLSGKTVEKGEVELALQYKDRKDTDIDDGRGYWLREYIKYNSRNELSHYWD